MDYKTNEYDLLVGQGVSKLDQILAIFLLLASLTKKKNCVCSASRGNIWCMYLRL